MRGPRHYTPLVPGVSAGGARVAICNWRDLRHPESGGSERYIETVARGLSARGNDVTLLSARVDGAPGDEEVDGLRYRRRGGRLTVYGAAAAALLLRRVDPDVVLDVQNGVPFLSPIVTGRRVAVLVHHVHREQWPLVLGGRRARIGWWVESRLGPAIYRHAPYMTESAATARELAALGVAPDRICVVGIGAPALPEPGARRSASPRIVVLGRLVPHKRVELALEAVARLRARFGDLVVDVVGRGYWEEHVRAAAHRLGLDGAVELHGFVDEQAKVDLLARAWVHVVPSVKEGWSLATIEAGLCGTLSVALAGSGGTEESVADGKTGLVVDGGSDALCDALAALLSDPVRIEAMGAAARAGALALSWSDTIGRISAVLDAAMGVPAGQPAGTSA